MSDDTLPPLAMEMADYLDRLIDKELDAAKKRLHREISAMRADVHGFNVSDPHAASQVEKANP